MDKNTEQALVGGIDVAQDRVEIGDIGWAQVGHTATKMCRPFAYIGQRLVRPSTARPWLRQKKGRGAQ